MKLFFLGFISCFFVSSLLAHPGKLTDKDDEGRLNSSYVLSQIAKMERISVEELIQQNRCMEESFPNLGRGEPLQNPMKAMNDASVATTLTTNTTLTNPTDELNSTNPQFKQRKFENSIESIELSALENLIQEIFSLILMYLPPGNYHSLEGTSKTLREKTLRSYTLLAPYKIFRADFFSITSSSNKDSPITWREKIFLDNFVRKAKKKSLLSPEKAERDLIKASVAGSLRAGIALLGYDSRLGLDHFDVHSNKLCIDPEGKVWSLLSQYACSPQQEEPEIEYYKAKILLLQHRLISKRPDSQKGTSDMLLKKSQEIISDLKKKPYISAYYLSYISDNKNVDDLNISAESGYIPSQYVRAKKEMKTNEKNGVSQLEALAEMGHTRSQVELREHYFKTNDLKSVARLSSDLAEKGHIESQYYIGLTYLYRDPGLAYYWLHQAAREGHQLASYELKRSR